VGIWVELSFAPAADVARALQHGDATEPLGRLAHHCGMRRSDWSCKHGVVTVSDAELRSATAWDPFVEALRRLAVAYDEVYEADPLGAVYIERWRPGMERPVTAARVEGDDAVTLRDLAAHAARCTSAAELLAFAQHQVGGDLPPLVAGR
jgi:hypothetical protein